VADRVVNSVINEKIFHMKKIVFYILLILIPVVLSVSCAGYVANPYSGVGIGVSGGPYGPHSVTNVRAGVYGGGYHR